MDTVRVACRVRLPGSGYAERYPFDVTFRCERPRSGAESELTKFVNGWGDFMLYGFGAESGEPKLERWVLVDLTALRALGLRHPKWFHSWARRTRKNPDGSSSFVVMRTDDVLARNHGVIRAASPGYYAKGSVPANTNGRIW